MGVLGIIGFFTTPFFCIFFGFFGWGLLGKEQFDERLAENVRKSEEIANKLALLLCFFMLFSLDKNVAARTVLLFGSIGYGAVFTLAPALAYYLDRRG